MIENNLFEGTSRSARGHQGSHALQLTYFTWGGAVHLAPAACSRQAPFGEDPTGPGAHRPGESSEPPSPGRNCLHGAVPLRVSAGSVAGAARVKINAEGDGGADLVAAKGAEAFENPGCNRRLTRDCLALTEAEVQSHALDGLLQG